MLLQFIVNGLIYGVLYSLMAIGFALVYNTTKIFHIAAAAIYVVAAFAFYFFYNTLGLNIILAGLLALAITSLVSVGTEATVYRPLYKKKASLNIVMIASIGLMTIIINLVAMLFGNETKVIDNSIQQTYSWGEIIVTTPQLLQLIIGSLAMLAFGLFLKFSRFGLRIKALSSDDVLFEVLGYNTRNTRIIVFMLSGVFIGLASCLTVYDIGLDPHMGMTVLINAMVAMIIGGVGRFNACVIGGLSLGVLQSLVVYQFASNWQNAITFTVLLLFLFLRPQGIVGIKKRAV